MTEPSQSASRTQALTHAILASTLHTAATFVLNDAKNTEGDQGHKKRKQKKKSPFYFQASHLTMKSKLKD